MQLEIITPEETIYRGEVDQITAKTVDGEITILPHHVNLFSKLLPGELIIKVGGKSQFLAVTGGFLEVDHNKVIILADYAVHADNIEIEEAVAAHKRAEEILKHKGEKLSKRDFVRAQADLSRAAAEIHVAKKRHRTKKTKHTKD